MVGWYFLLAGPLLTRRLLAFTGSQLARTGLESKLKAIHPSIHPSISTCFLYFSQCITLFILPTTSYFNSSILLLSIVLATPKTTKKNTTVFFIVNATSKSIRFKANAHKHTHMHARTPAGNTHANKQTNKHTNWQTRKQANKLANTQTSKQTNTQTGKHANKQTNWQTRKQANKLANTQTSKQTNTQTGKHANKQTNWQTRKQANTRTNRQRGKHTSNKTINLLQHSSPGPMPRKPKPTDTLETGSFQPVGSESSSEGTRWHKHEASKLGFRDSGLEFRVRVWGFGLGSGFRAYSEPQKVGTLI